MTTLKIRGGKLMFVRNAHSFCFPFRFQSDVEGNYTITGLNDEFEFSDHINNFLDESETPAWTDSFDALDEFLGKYSSVPVDTNTSDAIYELDDTMRTFFVQQGQMQTFYWQDNFQDVKMISAGKASLLGFRFHNKTTTAKTFRFYDVASLPILANTASRWQVTIEAGQSLNHHFNGHLIAAFSNKMAFTIHDNDAQATNIYTPSGTGYTVSIDWKNN